jgi:hypothetical protein
MGDGRLIDAFRSRAAKGSIMRLLMSTTCLCLLVFSAQGQLNSKEQSDKKPLTLELTASSTRACLRSTLPLELKITNRGDQEIRILKFNLWERFSYWRYREPEGYGFLASVISCSILPEDVASNPVYWAMLKPNETLTSSLKFGLGADFFQSPGRYRIETSYDHAKSNLIEFEIVDCNQN